MTNLSIRQLAEDDIPYLVAYLFNMTEENRIKIGADITKFSSKKEFADSLKVICNASIDTMNYYYMIWQVDNNPIGYSALKDIHKGAIANMHLHIWDCEYRGKGYGAKLFCMSALKFYHLFKLKLILCEPRSTNSMPNKMLMKIGFNKWKTYISTSSELALTCEVNSYIIDPKIAADHLGTVDQLEACTQLLL